jgi:ABC-2 type transport system permease protein
MILTLEKYLAVIRVNYYNSLAYIPEIISRILTVPFRIWIYAQVYLFTFQYKQLDDVNGLTAVTIVWILMMVQSAEMASRPDFSSIISDEIKLGDIGYILSKPYNYFFFHFSSFWGRGFITLLASFTLGSITAYLLVGVTHLYFYHLLGSIILLFTGMTIAFMISFIIGLSAFWIEDAAALEWMSHKFRLVLGGAIVPVALLPDNVALIVKYLPFANISYTAATHLTIKESNFWELWTIQLVWIAVLAFIIRIVYNKGIKNVTVNGG